MCMCGYLGVDSDGVAVTSDRHQLTEHTNLAADLESVVQELLLHTTIHIYNKVSDGIH